jgi:ribosome biogenesis protein UTP30
MRQNDLFLADERVLATLPKLLGREWLDKKRWGSQLATIVAPLYSTDNGRNLLPRPPIPVSIVHSDVKAELERAVASTYLYLAAGSCLTIKLGSLRLHSRGDLLENLLSVVPMLSIYLPFGGWDNIQALHVKTSTSVSLPVWNCELDERDRFKMGEKMKSKEGQRETKWARKVGAAKDKGVVSREDADEDVSKDGAVKPNSGARKARSSTLEKVKGLARAKATKSKMATKS